MGPYHVAAHATFPAGQGLMSSRREHAVEDRLRANAVDKCEEPYGLPKFEKLSSTTRFCARIRLKVVDDHEL